MILFKCVIQENDPFHEERRFPISEKRPIVEDVFCVPKLLF